jgi:hypothetical protein
MAERTEFVDQFHQFGGLVGHQGLGSIILLHLKKVLYNAS